MKYLKQVFIITVFCLAGELLAAIIPLPVPAAIYGIVLLFIALELKWVKVKQIREVSTTLIISMPVMFVPPAVGLISSWENIKDNWPEYLAITFASTFAVMAIAGWTTQRIILWQKNRRIQEESRNGKDNA